MTGFEFLAQLSIADGLASLYQNSQVSHCAIQHMPQRLIGDNVVRHAQTSTYLLWLLLIICWVEFPRSLAGVRYRPLTLAKLLYDGLIGFDCGHLDGRWRDDPFAKCRKPEESSEDFSGC